MFWMTVECGLGCPTVGMRLKDSGVCKACGMHVKVVPGGGMGVCWRCWRLGGLWLQLDAVPSTDMVLYFGGLVWR